MRIELLKERCAICDVQLRLIILLSVARQPASATFADTSASDPDEERINYNDNYFINCNVCYYTTKRANSKQQAAQNYFDLMISLNKQLQKTGWMLQ